LLVEESSKLKAGRAEGRVKKLKSLEDGSWEIAGAEGRVCYTNFWTGSRNT
jgi:hypothetical protein